MRSIFLLLLTFVLQSAYAQSIEQLQKIVPDDRAGFEKFGTTVAVDGNFAIVGAPMDLNDTTPVVSLGAAFLFEKDLISNEWNQVQKLVASDRLNLIFSATGPKFGESVAISGKYAIVGAPEDNLDVDGVTPTFSAGAAYIFEQSSTGEWVEVQKLVASDHESNARFGDAVGITFIAEIGWVAMVGAPYEDKDYLGSDTLTNAGGVYVFETNSLGQFQEVSKLFYSGREPAMIFGQALDLEGRDAIVGAPNASQSLSPAAPDVTGGGAAYLYHRLGDNSGWQQIARRISPTRGVNDNFGISVAIQEDLALIGCPGESSATAHKGGAAYLVPEEPFVTWGAVQRLAPSDSRDHDFFGIGVDIDGDQLIVGSMGDYSPSGDSLFNAGAAYIFERISSSDPFVESLKIVNTDRDKNDFFSGMLFSQGAVAVDDGIFLVGAHGQELDIDGLNPLIGSGAAYFFGIEDTSTTISTAIESLNAEDFLIYPNPAYESIQLEIPGISGMASVQLYNPLGLLLSSQTFTGNRMQIELPKSYSGWLLVEIEVNGVRSSVPVFKL